MHLCDLLPFFPYLIHTTHNSNTDCRALDFCTYIESDLSEDLDMEEVVDPFADVKKPAPLHQDRIL